MREIFWGSLCTVIRRFSELSLDILKNCTTLFILRKEKQKKYTHLLLFGFDNIHMFWVWKHAQYYFNNISTNHILYNKLNSLAFWKFRLCFIIRIQVVRNYTTPRCLFNFTNNCIFLYYRIFWYHLLLIH